MSTAITLITRQKGAAGITGNEAPVPQPWPPIQDDPVAPTQGGPAADPDPSSGLVARSGGAA